MLNKDNQDHQTKKAIYKKANLFPEVEYDWRDRLKDNAVCHSNDKKNISSSDEIKNNRNS